MIAALYVETGGVYFGLPNVDPWDKKRDARLYAGPYPVVAHPPCERWGRYWSGGPSGKVRRKKGDDANCFAAAIAAVRRWGGVLEHPEASHAWGFFGLNAPPRDGGWITADFYGGWTCCVEQGHYGHKARKMTWLYACRCTLVDLIWGSSGVRMRMDEGFHSTEARRKAVRAGALPRLSRSQRLSTPIPFRDLLIGLAENVGKSL
jgi:hypothetical protein